MIAGAVVGLAEQRPQTLAQRVVGKDARQFVDDVGVVTRVESCSLSQLGDDESSLGPTGSRAIDGIAVRNVEERFAAPLLERPVEDSEPVGRRWGGPCGVG